MLKQFAIVLAALLLAVLFAPLAGLPPAALMILEVAKWILPVGVLFLIVGAIGGFYDYGPAPDETKPEAAPSRASTNSAPHPPAYKGPRSDQDNTSDYDRTSSDLFDPLTVGVLTAAAVALSQDALAVSEPPPINDDCRATSNDYGSDVSSSSTDSCPAADTGPAFD